MFVWKEFPGRRPKFLRDKLVLAWIAYHSMAPGSSRGKAECHLSIRFLEMIFSYSSSSVAEACIKRLRQSATRTSSGWIVLSTKAAGIKGNHYCLGDSSIGQSDEWFSVGEMLYGPGGVLEPYRARPIFRGRGIGPSGCVVLAAIDKCGPIRQVDVIRTLKTFLGESAVKKRIKNLVAEGLVSKKDNFYFTTRTLAKKVEEFEKRYGLVEDHIKHHAELLAESLAFQVNLQGGPELTTLKAALRKLPCIYCQSLAPPEGGDHEHFPPRAWGGSDETSLLLPACRKCNRSHGPLLKQNLKPLVKPPTVEMRVVIDLEDESLQEWLAGAVVLSAQRYAIALNERNFDRAYAEVTATTTRLWAALRLGLLRHVHGTTGEINQVSGQTSLLDARSNFESLGGLVSVLKEK